MEKVYPYSFSSYCTCITKNCDSPVFMFSRIRINLVYISLQLDGQVIALLVQNLDRLDENVKEDSDGVHNTLGLYCSYLAYKKFPLNSKFHH